jgi:hypothetical protein
MFALSWPWSLRGAHQQEQQVQVKSSHSELLSLQAEREVHGPHEAHQGAAATRIHQTAPQNFQSLLTVNFTP